MYYKIVAILLFSTLCFSSEIEETLKKARAIKTKDSSFSLKEVSPGSIYEKLGIKSDDQIIKINNKKVDGMSEIMNAISNVKSITVIRNEKEKTKRLTD